MNFTRIMAPIPQTTRTLMKEGIKRNWIPASEFKGPVLKLSEGNKNTIKQYNSLIKQSLRAIDNLETEKAQIGLSSKEIMRLDESIKRHLASIAEAKKNIYDIKKDNYKTQILNEMG